MDYFFLSQIDNVVLLLQSFIQLLNIFTQLLYQITIHIHLSIQHLYFAVLRIIQMSEALYLLLE